jgi:hypothetical protein
MASGPSSFVEHLRAEGYHPRSNKHSNALARAIVHDLLERCSLIRERAAYGEITYTLNFTLHAGTSDWNVDLVLGPTVRGPQEGVSVRGILEEIPTSVRVAIEIKSVMTEHRKAVKNRKRDFEAHHEHVARYSQRTISGGVMVVNESVQFRSPLRSAMTTHARPKALTAHCVSQMRSVSERQTLAAVGMDAKAVLVVAMDNVDLNATRYVTKGEAPAAGDPLHYDSFIYRLCDLYQERFA